MRYVAFALAPPLVFLASSTFAAVPHHSFDQATVGNGFGFAVVDDVAHKLTTFTEAAHATKAPNVATRNLAYDAYFGLRASGAGGWLAEQAAAPTDSFGYVDDDAIVAMSQSFGPLSATTYAFSPFGLDAPSVVLVLSVTNTSGVAQPDAAAYSLLNFHLGSGAPSPGADGERITFANDAFAETGASGLTARYVSLAPSAHHGASPQNPYPIVKNGGDLVDVADSGTMSDAVAGFEWSLAGIAPGETRWVGVLVTLGDDASARAWIASRTPEAILNAEKSAWDAWRKPPPAGLSADETHVWRQSEAILRVAQSREPAPAKGQIVAALPPGQWWITWVRDMSYATAALARSGHADEANAAIDFWKGAKVGAYESYVGHPYYVSVVRYFGDGEEESDSNADGPNIEFDGFGLSTWAAHAAKRNDFDENAPLLASLIDSSNGLIDADSSIWEVHWNGKQKHYAYTSIAAARGLCDGGDAKSAQALRDAILAKLALPGGGIAQSLEELTNGTGAIDAAVIEAIDFGLINPLGDRAQKTYAALSALAAPSGHGFFRNDDGGGYDSQEWLFVDLRIADALRRMGKKQEAQLLLDWVTQQARLNQDLIPELLDRNTADYTGSIPMVGFGAGAYMLTLLDRAAPSAVDDPCFPKEGPDVVTPEPDPDAGANVDAGSDAGAGDAAANDAATNDAGSVDDGGANDAGAPQPSGGSSGGCQVGNGGSAYASIAILAMAAVFAARRRRTRDERWS